MYTLHEPRLVLCKYNHGLITTTKVIKNYQNNDHNVET